MTSPVAWDALVEVVEQLNEVVAVFCGPEHLLAYYNPALAALFGERPLGQHAGEAFPELPEWVALLDKTRDQGVPQWTIAMPVEVREGTDTEGGAGNFGNTGNTGNPPNISDISQAEVPSRRTTAGRQHLSLDVLSSPLRDGAGTQWGVLVLAREVTNRACRCREAQRTALIARIATDLSRSLDLEETARAVTRVGADLLEGWCTVDLVELDGSLRRLAGPTKSPSSSRYWRSWPPTPT